jgi:type VI protein secretion system component VasF
MKPDRSGEAASFAGRVRKRTGWLCGLAAIAVLVLAVGLGLLRVHAQQSASSLPAIDPPKTAAKTAAASPPDQPNSQAQQTSFSLPAIDPPRTDAKPAANSEQQNKEQDPGDKQPAAATAQGQGDAARECADLLKMATDLKAAVDKSSKDTLSVTVVRKADEIEQYAHKVRLGPGKS